MKLYATKFREKGDKEYKTVLIMAKDFDEYREKFADFLKVGEYDVDKRTISWAGNSVPFMSEGRAEVLCTNLDEVN